jgi:CDP-glycerol glycerophosphotransferase (TagB/SpsB family)
MEITFLGEHADYIGRSSPRLALRVFLKLGFSICTHINSKDERLPRVWPKGFERVDQADTVTCLSDCSLFISDYSGIILDALFLEKPVVFFSYDLDAYLRVRCLYVDYETFAFGPLVQRVADLVTLITNETWNTGSSYQEQRAQCTAEIFPYGKTGYAERGYTAIRALLDGTPPNAVR